MAWFTGDEWEEHEERRYNYTEKRYYWIKIRVNRKTGERTTEFLYWED